MGDGSVAGPGEAPMPNAGTDTPAAPSLLMAPWFRTPAPPVGEGLCTGVEPPEPVRGGRRGGKRGGQALAGAATTESYEGGGGDMPPAPSLLPGGRGR